MYMYIIFCFRMLPAIARNDRKCVKDWEYKGYKIKKVRNIISQLLAFLKFPLQKFNHLISKSSLIKYVS